MDLHPEFPIVSGHYRITKEWSLNLPIELNRRVEDGSLVLWRPEFTLWLEAWGNNKSESQKARLKWLKEATTPAAYDVKEKLSNGVLRFSYRLAEQAEDKRQPAFYCFAIGSNGHLQMVFYFDKEESISTAERICESAAESAL